MFSLPFRCLYRSPDILMNPTNIFVEEVTPSTLMPVEFLSHPIDTIQRKDMGENIPASTAKIENENHSSRTNNHFTDSNVVVADWKPIVAGPQIMETVNKHSPELRLEKSNDKVIYSPILYDGIPPAQQSNAIYNSNDEHQNSSVVGTDKAGETHNHDNQTGQKEDIRMEEVMELLKQRWLDLLCNKSAASLQNSERPKLRTEQSAHNSNTNQLWIELLNRHSNIMEYVSGDKPSNYDERIEKLVGIELVRIIRFGDLDSFSTFGSSIRILRLVKCNLKNEQLYGLEKLRNLELLDLSENELKHFTTDENALPHLIALNLSDNRICTLDELSGPYPALRELNISSNFLMRIDRRSISNISPQLYTLNLSDNLITRTSHSEGASATSVCHLPLGRINLTGNQLSHLDGSISTDYLATSFDFTSNLLQQVIIKSLGESLY
ncbi:hypothetical protein PHET_05461 [Paragonimus heterotremus]|uniref:Uncharacterized protein n=1 Tax=Paragonimus heterotremus TaxID=100268 RepID=A0A8J4TFD9_9TREM|nr:hypothetical protein PHET_05461 [Paragonimus heterotremus]